MSGKTVVFDLGEVLVPSTGVLPVLAAELGVDVAGLHPAYWADRLAFDRGGDPETYWAGVLRRLGRAPDPELGRRLSAIDSAKWSQLPPVSSALLDGLADTRLAVLSNAPAPLAAAVRAAPWSAAVEVLVFSADLGVAKPDPQIYALADRAYGTAPADVVFFDDRAPNVDAARAHGWDAHVWAGPEAALAVIGG